VDGSFRYDSALEIENGSDKQNQNKAKHPQDNTKTINHIDCTAINATANKRKMQNGSLGCGVTKWGFWILCHSDIDLKKPFTHPIYIRLENLSSSDLRSNPKKKSNRNLKSYLKP
jgi:hypothetical protein